MNVALAIGAGRDGLWAEAAHHVGRLGARLSGKEHFARIAGCRLDCVLRQPGRASRGRAVEDLRIDRLQPPGHVARHRALGNLQEKEAFGCVNIVEECPAPGAVTFEPRPGQVEIDALDDRGGSLCLEADHVGRQAQVILADEDVEKLVARGVAGKGEVFAEPAPCK
ncbi:hypothetical protein D9M72_500670 [compost metagenome]